jgi:hypothetical protein
MTDIQRYSPVIFEPDALETETRDNWQIVLAYAEEGGGPWLVDLSHKTRWDLQDSQIGDLSPMGITVPSAPGACALNNDILINRMNGTQAAIWHLGTAVAKKPDIKGCTDVTESTVFLALFGSKAFHIAEKLTALDFMDAARKAPFLLQGPFCHVPCQIVALEKKTDMSGGLLLTCSRGYAESMVQAVLDSGAEFGLRPAGETRFTDWVQKLQDLAREL